MRGIRLGPRRSLSSSAGLTDQNQSISVYVLEPIHGLDDSLTDTLVKSILLLAIFTVERQGIVHFLSIEKTIADVASHLLNLKPYRE